MFFLIRTAFWLSLVIMLLPADVKSGAEAPRVTVIETLVAARSAVADMSGFCGRNPQTCVTGHAALQVFVGKARYGYFEPAKSASEPPSDQPQNTLKSEDIAPAWRAPHGHNAA